MAKGTAPNYPYTDAELQNIALLNVGYASEVRNSSSYNLAIAWTKVNQSNLNDPGHKHFGKPYQHAIGDWKPIGNSGYSLGSLQSDFGQRAHLVNDLVLQYENWAGNDPNKLIDPNTDLRALLKMQGRPLDENRIDMKQLPIPASDKAKFSDFLASDQGRQAVWDLDQKQINDKLLPYAKKVMDTTFFKSLTDDLEKVSVLSTSMKLHNQAEGKAASLLKMMENGKFSTFADIEKEINSPNYASYIQSGFTHTKDGAELYNKISNSNTVLNAWLIAHKTTNLSTLPEPDYKDDLRFQVLNRMFRDPDKGKAFVGNLEQGKPMLMAVPTSARDGTQKIIGIDKNGDMFVADQDGKNLNQFINGTWQQQSGGTPVIKQNKNGNWVLALGNSEIDFGNSSEFAMSQPNKDNTAAVTLENDPKYTAIQIEAERELREKNPKAFKTAIAFEVVEEMLREKGELSALTPQKLEQKTAQHLWRLNESENGVDLRREFATDMLKPQSKTGNYDVDPKKLGELVQLAQALPDGDLKDQLNQRVATFLNDSGAKIAQTEHQQDFV
ncbi:MAG: hypothetical protein WBL28_10550 [Methylotenera sp.]